MSETKRQEIYNYEEYDDDCIKEICDDLEECFRKCNEKNQCEDLIRGIIGLPKWYVWSRINNMAKTNNIQIKREDFWDIKIKLADEKIKYLIFEEEEAFKNLLYNVFYLKAEELILPNNVKVEKEYGFENFDGEQAILISLAIGFPHGIIKYKKREFFWFFYDGTLLVCKSNMLNGLELYDDYEEEID
ncbi:MAG: hypothetical protein PHR25_04375 [Clostridia bacterium]|nr:hypothetical protein [Clostridia bacterium]MDD4375999.1 hypothetical protein [Clostridia bacterium]